MNDAELINACPDYISVAGIFKATPKTEGDKRFVYMEASSEGRDQQGEVIIAKALSESSDFFLRYGNVDIDHYTKIGPRLGIQDSSSYEIGLPKEVRRDGSQTFVKAEIYQGDGQAAIKANQFWSSLTDINPPARWYPSVGGSALEKSVEVDADGIRKAVIKKLRWFNIGMSKTPVNQHVGTCAAVPIGAFNKCLLNGGLDVAKALEAGYGTDSAALTGGGALRKQSLDGKPANYFDFRNKLAAAMRSGAPGKNPGSSDLVRYASETYGMSPDESSEHVERFMRDLQTGLKRKAS